MSVIGTAALREPLSVNALTGADRAVGDPPGLSSTDLAIV
jgi:hypothetical protein